MKAVVRLVAQALVLALLWSAAVGHAQAPASAKARARELYGQGHTVRNCEFGAANGVRRRVPTVPSGGLAQRRGVQVESKTRGALPA